MQQLVLDINDSGETIATYVEKKIKIKKDNFLDVFKGISTDDSKSLYFNKTVNSVIKDIKQHKETKVVKNVLLFLNSLNKCKSKTKWIYFHRVSIHNTNGEGKFKMGFALSFYHKNHKQKSFYDLFITEDFYFKKAKRYEESDRYWCNGESGIVAILMDIENEYNSRFDDDKIN